MNRKERRASKMENPNFIGKYSISKMKIRDIPKIIQEQEKKKIMAISFRLHEGMIFLIKKLGIHADSVHFRLKFILLAMNPHFESMLIDMQKKGDIEDLQHYYILKKANGDVEKIAYWIGKTDVLETSEGYEIDFDIIAANVMEIIQELYKLEMDDDRKLELIKAIANEIAKPELVMADMEKMGKGTEFLSIQFGERV